MIQYTIIFPKDHGFPVGMGTYIAVLQRV